MTESHISLEEARRRADEKRESFTQATEALKSRVEEDAGEMNALVIRARTTARTADEAIKRYHLVALGAAVAFGMVMGKKSARKRKRERLLEEGEQAIVLQKAPKKPTMFASFLGTVAGLVARQVAFTIVQSLQKSSDD